MSFILDALKKSESERQRQDAPGIASIPETGQQPGKSRWPWVIAVLMIINLGVLAAIVMQPDAEPVQPVASVAEPGSATQPASESFSASVREAERTTPEPVMTSASEPQAALPQEMPTSIPAPAPAPTQPVTDGLPTFNDLRINGQLQLPDLHLDIHVYSAQPADRFVFVNMSKYKESATLSEGPRVSEIVPDGVVLDYMGNRFLLPRE